MKDKISNWPEIALYFGICLWVIATGAGILMGMDCSGLMMICK